jgi:acyl-CoA thioesterase II
MAIPLSDAVASFTLTQTGDAEFTGPNMEYYGPGRDVLFAGQLVGQAIMAATLGHEAKTVKTISMHFPRSGRVSEPTQLRVRQINSSSSFATAAVSALQGSRLVGEALILLHSQDENAVYHSNSAAGAGSPEDAEARPTSIEGYLTRVADGVDYMSAGDVGEPRMRVWTRFDGAPSNQALQQALLAIPAVPFLIGVALRPHEGVTIADAHKTLSTGVMSHTLTFHEPIDLGRWHLFVHEAPYAGHGRSYGKGEVFTQSGELVASFSQDGMLRKLDKATAATTSSATRL